MALNIGGTPSLANTQVNQISILNATVPPEGPKALPLVLDFTATNSILVDLTITTQQVLISTVQAIWADNSGNSAPLHVTIAATGQKLIIPAGFQGWFAIAATNRPKLVFATTAGVIIEAMLLNVPVSQGLWSSFDADERSGAVSPLAITVATGGTAVTVFSSTSPNVMPSAGAVIRNPYNATESLYVDIVNAAQVSQSGGTNGTSIELEAGDSFVVPPNFTGTVSVNAATSAHAFAAYGVGHT